MEYTGPPEILINVFGVLILVGIAALALWRGEGARSQGKEGVTQVRTKRAYWCFLIWGAFVISFGAVVLYPANERQAVATLVGIFFGVPAAIAALIGLFHGLMVWKVALIRLLLLATVTVMPMLFSDLFGEPWTSIIAAGYGVLVLAVSVRGLRGPRTAAAS
jgi:magnesium-transporting ATPase (P-type)